MTLFAIGLFVCGLLIKGGLVPFHGWLPAAYSAAPAAVSVLLGRYHHKGLGHIYAHSACDLGFWPEQFDKHSSYAGRHHFNPGRRLCRDRTNRFQKDARVFEYQPGWLHCSWPWLRHASGNCRSGFPPVQSLDFQISLVCQFRRCRRAARHNRYESDGRPGYKNACYKRHFADRVSFNGGRSAAFGFLEQTDYHYSSVAERVIMFMPSLRYWPVFLRLAICS